MQSPLFNITTGADSYKASHWKQIPPGTKKISAYFAPRGNNEDWAGYMVMYALQFILKRFLVGRVVTMDDVELAAKRWAAHFGDDTIFNYHGWKHIAQFHDGHLPLSIMSVLEGTVLPVGNVAYRVDNTCDQCAWLTTWAEDVLSHVWYGSTVATNSRECKYILLDALEKTGTPEQYQYKLHDFAFRGVTCPEQAAIGGAAHLLSFLGTDTFIACCMLMDMYGATEMPGHSIPASEHSTITAWGRQGELEFVKHLLTQFPSGLVANVCDSYDLANMVNNYICKDLKERILARSGVFVVRPDSGEPAATVLSVLESLGEGFGTVRNDKGFKLLPPQIRVIQGDGMDKKMLKYILTELIKKDWSIDNIAFGSGGGLLQKFNRDDLQCAYKGSWIAGEDWERDIYKDPITMPSKKSMRGRLQLLELDGHYASVAEGEVPPAYRNLPNQLQQTYRDGEILIEQIHKDIVVRAA
jgi:nicotinamide phosphoribosyltransferase